MPADSPQFPDALVKAIKEGRLVPFVGAGVSMSLRYADGKAVFPSWEGLIWGMANRLEREGQPQAALVKAHLTQPVPDLLEAARYARKGLGGQWVEVLEEAFEPDLSGFSLGALALPQAVWGLGSNLVVTTNYDKVLQRAATDPHSVRTVGISPPQVARLPAGTAKPTVWHLHGHIGEPHQIVLTPDSYNTLYPDGPGTAETAKQHEGALTVLRSMLGSWTFLFVGFSMADAAFVRQLEWLRDTFPGANGPHYVLVKASDAKALLTLLSEKQLDVRPVVFSDFGAPMVQVLKDLAAVAGRAVPVPGAAKTDARQSTSGTAAAPKQVSGGAGAASMDRKFTHDEIWELIDAALATMLYAGGNRELHFADLPRSFWGTLPEKQNPRDALLSDLTELNLHEEIQGHTGRPIQAWLAVAWRRAQPHREADVFARFLTRRPRVVSPPRAPDEADSESHIGGDEDLRAELEAFWLGHPHEAALIAEELHLVGPGVDLTTLDTLAKVLACPPEAIVLGIEDAAGRVGAAELSPFLELLPLVARWLAQPDRDGLRTGAIRWPKKPSVDSLVSGGPALLELPLKSPTLTEVYVAALQGRAPSFKQPGMGEKVQAEGDHHVGFSSAVEAGLIDVKQMMRATVSTLEQREQLQMVVANRVGGWTGRGDLPQFKGWLLRQRKTSKGGKPSWYVVFDVAKCQPDKAPPSANEALWATVSHAFAECMSQLTLYRVRGGFIDEALEHMIAYAMTEILRRQMETKA